MIIAINSDEKIKEWRNTPFSHGVPLAVVSQKTDYLFCGGLTVISYYSWVPHRGKEKLSPDFYPVLEQIITYYNELEDLCEAPKFRTFPLDIPFKSHTDHDVEEAALMTRELFGIRHAIIYDLFELFESNGLRIVTLSLPKHVDGLAYASPQNDQITFFINHESTMERKIFTLVHELEHLIFHRKRSFSLEQDNAHEEYLVNHFSAAFLMPKQTLAKSIESHGIGKTDWDIKLVLTFKSMFGVSSEAFLRRIAGLNLIDKKSYTKLLRSIKSQYAVSGFTEPEECRTESISNHRINNLIYILSKKNKRKKNTAEQLSSMLKSLNVVL